MVLVVFATNIKPAELVDEAFLRRIHYKVFAESPTPADFTQIFEDYCRSEEPGASTARWPSISSTSTSARAAFRCAAASRATIEQALAHAEYVGAPRRADR